MDKNSLYVSFVFALMLYAMHAAAVEFSLYWLLWWYDIPMHFLGGLVLGSGFFWLFSMVLKTSGRSNGFLILSVLVSVLAGGIAWELFEYHYGLFYHPNVSYAFDTSKDLVLDVLGGAVPLLFFIRRIPVTEATHV